MFKTLLLSLALLGSLPAFAATGYTTMVASNVVDAGGNALASGTATISVVDAAAHPLSVQLGGGGGQVHTAPVSVQVINGAFSAQVVDVSLTTPSFPCVQVVITDNSSGNVVWQNNCIQPTGAVYDLDLFSTNTTPVFPQAGDTVAGNLGVNGNLSVTGNLNMGGLNVGIETATVVTSQTTNGVLNAAQFPGADLGAKVNAAFASLTSGGTVAIPTGSYSFGTTITFPASGYHIDCDAGATMTYTGTSTAIAVSTIGQADLGIDGHGGCLLQGTGQQGTGIDMNATNQTYVTGMRIKNFAKGLYLQGANTVEVLNDTFQGNARGIDMITAPGYAPNAVHVAYNEFIQNGWGAYSENGGFQASHALGNAYTNNTFEQDTNGDLWLAWDAQTEVAFNYFAMRPMRRPATSQRTGKNSTST